MSESSIVIYQVGSKSYNPKTKNHYDPWENHIWTSLEQARKWSPNSKIVVILDDENVYNKQNFEKLNIKWEKISDLKPRYNEDLISQSDGGKKWEGDTDPLWKACLMRPFYIEEVMKKHNLTNTFSFDNDVMIYCNLDEIAEKLSRVYARTAMTAEHENALIFGMVYIRDYKALVDINDKFWNLINEKDNPQNHLDMLLWRRTQLELGDAYVDTLPIWVDGSFSKFWSYIGGIFDPISIGQFLGGSNLGHTPGTIFTHHYIGRMLQTQKWGFSEMLTEDGKRYFVVVDKTTGNKVKILSLHIHGKELKKFTS